MLNLLQSLTEPTLSSTSTLSGHGAFLALPGSLLRHLEAQETIPQVVLNATLCVCLEASRGKYALPPTDRTCYSCTVAPCPWCLVEGVIATCFGGRRAWR